MNIFRYSTVILMTFLDYRQFILKIACALRSNVQIFCKILCTTYSLQTLAKKISLAGRAGREVTRSVSAYFGPFWPGETVISPQPSRLACPPVPGKPPWQTITHGIVA